MPLIKMRLPFFFSLLSEVARVPTLEDARVQLVALDDTLTVVRNMIVDLGCHRIGHSTLSIVVTSFVEMRLSEAWCVTAGFR